MSSIGSYLKQTRESMGYSLDQVQKSTKIHIEYLRALENDQFDALPSPFYVRAFLRTYAHSLGLDAQPLLDRYERFATTGRPSIRRTPQFTPQKPNSKPVSPPARSKMSGTHPRLGRTYSPQSQRMTPALPISPPQQPTEQQQPNTQYFNGHVPPVQPTQPPNPPAQEPQLPQSTNATPSEPEAGPSEPTTGQATQQQQAAPKQPTRPAPKQSEPVTQSTFAPRRVSRVMRRGKEQGDGNPKKKANWFVRVAAVGALILIPLGAYVSGVMPFTSTPEATDPKQPQEPAADSGSTPTVDAQTPAEMNLQKVETGSDMEGDLYTLEGAEQLDIEVKANKGESQLRFGNKVNDPNGETFELQIGDRKKINDDKTVWFRLGAPSNTEIKVNGLEIDTTAQDVPKSYRIQLEK